MNYRTARRLLAPEVVQTSAMDCGPAALASLLLGFDIPVSYERLRELCQTSIDGTSIDVIEETANLLGLEAEQVLVPLDHLLLSEANCLPGIVVVSTNKRSTHFVVAWKRTLGRVALMDPARGRRWPRSHDLIDEVYVHTQSVPAKDWTAWAESPDFTAPLARRLLDLGLSRSEAEVRITSAAEQNSWSDWGLLDAATRLTQSLVTSGALLRGKEAKNFLVGCLETGGSKSHIPDRWWCVRPDPSVEDHLLFTGAVVVRALGKSSTPPQAELHSDLFRVTAKPIQSATRRLVRLLKGEEPVALTLLAINIAIAATVVVFEAILFRGLLDLQKDVTDVPQRLEVFGAVLLLVGLGVLLRLDSDSRCRRLGLRVETNLRMRLFRKLPLLHDRFLRSRPISDMAQRVHELRQARAAIKLGALSLRGAFEVLLTGVGMALLHPPMSGWIAAAVFAGVAVPLLALSAVSEKDHRVRTHEGALSRFLFDSLKGLSAVRAHRAERAIDVQHEELLESWKASRMSLDRMRIGTDAIQLALVLAIMIGVVLHYLATVPRAVDALLLGYWGLELAFRCRVMVTGVRQFSLKANAVARILEPLETAPRPTDTPASSEGSASSLTQAMALRLQGIEVRAGGHPLLEEIDLEIPAGQHVAIVGPSGAGKTTLIGTILGWHRPNQGSLFVDGHPVTEERLNALRNRVAWVDPSIQLWNTTLLDNLRYGTEESSHSDWSEFFERIELRGIVQALPEGLQTPLGESGLTLSGGEGQRVRLGRALRRQGTGLVLLDEAFRGLGRAQRTRLLERARSHWNSATLLCVTHDVSATTNFDRILVIEEGKITEDGTPTDLQEPGSRYSELLRAEGSIQTDLWGLPDWRRLWIQEGRLSINQTPTERSE